jgi:hypothetical protein
LRESGGAFGLVKIAMIALSWDACHAGRYALVKDGPRSEHVQQGVRAIDYELSTTYLIRLEPSKQIYALSLGVFTIVAVFEQTQTI